MHQKQNQKLRELSNNNIDAYSVAKTLQHISLGITQSYFSKKKLFYDLLIIIKVSKGAKIRNRYNQVPHLTQDTNGKLTNSQ